ncbi:MAG TPA: SgcJ/EcaC family oxidoreductase [Chitinophagaceae bacterium]|nr:SgcJ/EcaC family oxidoreductase [Chitinophagaceae bacterium]
MRLFIMLASVMLFFILMSCKQDHNQGKDEDAIRNVILQMTEGFNKHDAKAATQMYTSNADFVNVRGDKYTGAAEIEQKLAAILSTRAKEATLKTLNTTIRFVNPELAIAHVTNELSGLVDSAGLKLPSHQELSIRVFIKEKGNWRVTAFHNTMIRPF